MRSQQKSGHNILGSMLASSNLLKLPPNIRFQQSLEFGVRGLGFKVRVEGWALRIYSLYLRLDVMVVRDPR